MMIFEPKAPTSPETFYPWMVAIVVGCLGVAQQFCLIGKFIIHSLILSIDVQQYIFVRHIAKIEFKVTNFAQEVQIVYKL